MKKKKQVKAYFLYDDKKQQKISLKGFCFSFIIRKCLTPISPSSVLRTSSPSWGSHPRPGGRGRVRKHRGEGALKLIVIPEGCCRESTPLVLL